MVCHVCRTKWQSNPRHDTSGGSSGKGSKLTFVSCIFKGEQKELFLGSESIELHKFSISFSFAKVSDMLHFFSAEAFAVGYLLWSTDVKVFCFNVQTSGTEFGIAICSISVLRYVTSQWTSLPKHLSFSLACQDFEPDACHGRASTDCLGRFEVLALCVLILFPSSIFNLNKLTEMVFVQLAFQISNRFHGRSSSFCHGESHKNYVLKYSEIRLIDKSMSSEDCKAGLDSLFVSF